MPFVNRIRLPFKLTRAQFPAEKTVYRKANGEAITLSVIVRKTYQGETDHWPEKWHERFRIALAHDSVSVEGEKYVGMISQDGDYTIQWGDFLDYPTAKAEFTAEVTPFDASNSNCMSCEEATQLDLEDDEFQDAYGEALSLEEGSEHEINVAANDAICCYPAEFSITSFNSTYLASAEIDQEGNLTVVLNTGLIAGNNILLVTYRVTCPGGGYDEADVMGTVNGTVPGCMGPDEDSFTTITLDSYNHDVEWANPTPTPDSYRYEVYAVSDPGTLVFFSTTDTTFRRALIFGLTPDTDYVLHVYGVCGGSDSAPSDHFFTTEALSEECGRYEIFYDDGSGNHNFHTVTYVNCDGDTVNTGVMNTSSRIICAAQNSPGDPVFIVGATDINYLSLC